MMFLLSHHIIQLSECLVDRLSLFQEAKARKMRGLDPLDFAAAAQLKKTPVTLEVMPEEHLTNVQDLLECDTTGRYRSLAGSWMTFEFLVGNARECCHK